MIRTLAAALLLATLSARADSRVETRDLDGGRLIAVAVEGKLLDVAQGLLLLVAPPEQGPPQLYHLDSGSTELRLLSTSLPREIDTVAVFDLDGDGRRDVVLGEPGKLYRAGTVGERIEVTAPVVVLEAEVDLRELAAGGFLASPLTVPQIGRLTTFAPDDDGRLAAALERELPRRARRRPTGLVLSTPRVRLVERPGQEPLFVVGPEALGTRRLRTLLLGPGEERVEAWSWLPDAEEVVDSWYADLNGVPALLVATVSARQIGLFEQKKLRVFPLRGGDRSRTGRGASLKVETASHRWQRLDPTAVDVTGDGLLDLVVVQPEGLGGKKLIVEAYPGRADARFHSIPLRTVVPARQAVWSFGVDVTGDGAADLVARSGVDLRVFAGILASGKKQVLEKRPRWEVELGSPDAAQATEGEPELVIRGRPEVRDIDGDGRAEVLVRGRRSGWSVLWVLDPG